MYPYIPFMGLYRVPFSPIPYSPTASKARGDGRQTGKGGALYVGGAN